MTGNYLTEVKGQREQLVGKIQNLYGIAKDKAAGQLKEFKRGM